MKMFFHGLLNDAMSAAWVALCGINTGNKA